MNPVWPRLDPRALDLDCPREVSRVASRLAEIVGSDLHRRGIVVALSGGVDSSVCAALSARAVGPARTVALLLPERESSPTSVALARHVAAGLGIATITEDITASLEALGCYRRRDEAIRALVPEYGQGWRSKIVISGGLEGRFNCFSLVVSSPDGGLRKARLPLPQYLQIVAAQNFKQRVRKTIEYFHADRLHYAVVGTPNRVEYDQGFFVKNGDGSADVKPIAHLYKTQVYQLARHLGLPAEVCESLPTTDTYSLPQGQDEFYFGLPYRQMDLALWAHDHAMPAETLAEAIGIGVEEAGFVYRDIEAKRRSTRYQHMPPFLLDEPPGGDSPARAHEPA